MRILALGYVVIDTQQLDTWKTFAEQVIGLMPAHHTTDDGALYYKMDAYTWRLCIRRATHEKLAIAGWEVETQSDFLAMCETLTANGIAFSVADQDLCHRRGVQSLLCVNDPSGAQLEIFCKMKLDYVRFNSPVGVRGFVTGYHGDMGLGHFVIPTRAFSETFDFYTKVLGFGETDYMHFHFSPDPNDAGQGLHFLHAKSSRHHSLALFQDPQPPAHGCVHLMVEVGDIDEVGYFMDRCREHQVPVVSSLGRHSNDLMMSVYVATPSGFALEFGCDGVQLDWKNYKPTVSSRPSLWGHSWQLG